MSFKALPVDWQEWVTTNVASGCTDETLLPALIQNGFVFQIAARALFEARQAHTGVAGGAVLAKPRPFVSEGANTLRCADGQVVRVTMGLNSPSVVLFENLLSAAECDEMVALADLRLHASKVVDAQLGSEIAHEHRTSKGGAFVRGEFELIGRLERRIAEVAHWPVEHGEGLQVLRYGVGGEYRPHYDYFDPALAGSAKHLAVAGQRVATVIVYLSDVEAGGGTTLPNLGFEARPQKGSALFFCNVDKSGAIDPSTLHAGVPVAAGVKYIATKWLRERVF